MDNNQASVCLSFSDMLLSIYVSGQFINLTAPIYARSLRHA